MDPQTLPAASQELYQKIKQQYRVGFESLKLSDELQLHLLKIIDLEQLLDGKDPF
ncbi:MAG: methyltransferase, partial [Candidatus Electrothrix sp. AUS4]|nr:methyltransferase [Candidatus Electrothrix sp. AUS4]